jgi:hypothetical protein
MREESDAERRTRHLEWAAVNGCPLEQSARDNYRQRGRGFWLTSDILDHPDGQTEVSWVALADCRDLLEGPIGRDVERLVSTYSPDHQFVLVINEGDQMWGYKLGHVWPDRN